MSKVLISFLGTSNPTLEENGYRKYRLTKYHFFDDGKEIESAFVAFALKRHYGMDKVILIGTPKSMWEEVYASANGGRVDDVYTDIWKYCNEANAQTPLTPIPHQELIENSLGQGSKVILVNYGIKESEMDVNAQIVFSIEQYLQTDDELYLDITHSFRSLPLHLMNALVYLKNVSSKKLELKSIFYGMAEVIKEFNYAPVVELNPVLDMSDWISAASDFMKSGNAYQVAELLKKTNNAKDIEIAKKLVRFSNLVNLNHIAGVESLVNELQSIDEIMKGASMRAQMVVQPVVQKFLESFKDAKTLSQKQFCLAEYQNSLHHYASALICLAEAIVTWACEQLGFDSKCKDYQNLVKTMIIRPKKKIVIAPKSKVTQSDLKKVQEFQSHYSDEELESLKQIFNAVNHNRKDVAHSLGLNTQEDSMIAGLYLGLKEFRSWVFE